MTKYALQHPDGGVLWVGLAESRQGAIHAWSRAAANGEAEDFIGFEPDFGNVSEATDTDEAEWYAERFAKDATEEGLHRALDLISAIRGCEPASVYRALDAATAVLAGHE